MIARKWTKSSEAYTGLGLFVSTASCDNEQQKKDCYHLAKCRGIQLIDERERITDVVKMEKDPCWDVPFITLTIDEPKNWLKLERGQHYRIHLTENVFNSKNVTLFLKCTGNIIIGVLEGWKEKSDQVQKHNSLQKSRNCELWKFFVIYEQFKNG